MIRTITLSVGAAALALSLACTQESRPSETALDIQTIVGGNFTPDGVGPDLHRQTLERLHQRPDAYLTTFAEMYAGQRFEPQKWADLYLPTFLELVQKDEPARSREVARRLIERLDAVLYTLDQSRDRDAFLKLLSSEAARVVQRLDRQRAELRALLSEK
ncbi:hypothetical protein RAS1_20640 [Phycisphaerae bacterium RAS1]|nr:hypothetical protein RAS1_20640 [Phycisphaerae bacterium RAS1]